MFDHLLRQLKDRLLAPIALWLGPAISPNAVSLLAFGVGLLCAMAVQRGANGVAFGLWIANRILDGLDGSMARAHDRQSDFGGYLDIMLDFLVYAAVPVGMMLGSPSRELLIAGMWLLAAFFVNTASWMYLAAILERRAAGAESTGELTTITMPPGIVAGTETVLFYSVFLLVPAWRSHGFLIMALLVMVNVGQRLWWAWRRLHTSSTGTR